MPRGMYIRTAEHCINTSNSIKGRTIPLEQRQRQSKAMKEVAKNPEWRKSVSIGTQIRMHDPIIRERHLSGLARNFKQAVNGNNFNGGKGTLPNAEETSYSWLCEIGYETRVQVGPYTLDYALVVAKIDIEIDGSSHRHRKEADERRDDFLRRLEWKVIRIKV